MISFYYNCSKNSIEIYMKILTVFEEAGLLTKRFLSFLMILVMISILFSGCISGTATASSTGFRSEVRIEVSVGRDGALTVSQLSHNETPGIGDFGVTATVARMNEMQSIKVDAVAGATVSSLAVINAAEKAINKLSSSTHHFLNDPMLHASEYRTLSYDVVVIGAGGAGLLAAIEASQHASVLVLERMGIPGGSTARSDGMIQATGTPLQEKYREIDSAASFAGYLFTYADPALGSFRQLELAEHSADNIRFLENLGVKFSSQIFSSFEGQSPRRVHQVASGNDSSGGHLIKPLVDKALSLGVNFLYDTRVTELTQDIYGTVSGVKAYNAFGDQYTVTADAVIIATGGYDRNPSLISRYGLSFSSTLTSPGNTGDGVEIARQIGAKIFTTGSIIATLEDLGTGLFDTTGLIVDPSGKRIENEAGEKFDLTAELMSRGYSEAWLITDAVAYNQAVRDGLNVDKVVTADTIEELSKKIDADLLQKNVNEYNRSCRLGRDDDFGKDRKYLGNIGQAPFCAVKLKFRCYGTLGGIMTNNRCQVIDNNGNIIPHLYAAGEVMNGAYFISGLPGSGASLAQVIETGRLAGKNVIIYDILGEQ